MGQSVDVVVSELHSAAARLEDAGQRLQDGLSSVDLEVGQLMGSGWKGGAASAYDKAWDQWHGGAGQVVRGLQTMSQLLTVAGKEYAKIDEQGAKAVDSQMQTTGDPGGSGSGTGGMAAGQIAGGSPSGTDATGSAAGSSTGAGGDQGAGQPAASPTSPMSLLGQLGQALQPLAQSGQAAAGIAQLAAQMALGEVQEATSAAQDGDETDAESPTDGAAPSDDQSTAAPIETPRPGSQSAPGELSGE